MRVLAVVTGIAFVMISVAYGIAYIFGEGSIKLPIRLYYITFIFSILFVIFSVFLEKERDVVYPWYLLGGAIASAISSFIITASIGGIIYVYEKGLGGLSIETVFYALSLFIVLSMVLFNLARHKL